MPVTILHPPGTEDLVMIHFNLSSKVKQSQWWFREPHQEHHPLLCGLKDLSAARYVQYPALNVFVSGALI